MHLTSLCSSSPQLEAERRGLARDPLWGEEESLESSNDLCFPFIRFFFCSTTREGSRD